MDNKPWISGPREILQHAIELVDTGSEASYRIAFLIIDNAVELMMKTFLSLPARITGVKVGRKEVDENFSNFPRLIELIESCAPEKFNNISINEIEWYHRLRNQLYHQGNGLTIEQEKVDKYLELAKKLFFSLFDQEIQLDVINENDLLVTFLTKWETLERLIARTRLCLDNDYEVDIAFPETRKALDDLILWVFYDLEVYYKERYQLERLYELRNDIMDGNKRYRQTLTLDMIKELDYFIDVSKKYLEID